MANMAKMQRAVLSVAVLLLATCSRGEALSCYNCLLLEVDGVAYSDPLCGKAGESPNDEYLIDCSDPDSRRTGLFFGNHSGPNFNFSRNSGIHQFQADASTNQAEGAMGCMYMQGSGVTAVGEHVTVVVRNCYSTSLPQFENCEEKTVDKWRAGEDNWSYVIHDAANFLRLPDDAIVDACYCAGEQCNNGDMGSGCNKAK